MVGNVAVYVGVILVPLALFWLVCHGPGKVRAVRQRRHPEPPANPPIERIADDLRRVRRARLSLPEGTNHVRRTATEQAYDALLRQAARALRVPERLGETRVGLDHELERLRVEEELTAAGLRIR